MKEPPDRILHVVSDRRFDNGMHRVAQLLAKERGGDATVITAQEFLSTPLGDYTADNRPGEIWVHGCWLPIYWKCCWKVLSTHSLSLVRMTHGSLSPVYLAHQGKWKKRLVGPIERWFLRRSDRLVATCPAEAQWIRSWLHLTDPRRTSSSGRPLRREPEIEIIDLRRFFNLAETSPVDAVSSPRPADSKISAVTRRDSASSDLHVLYLGRRHPLKGVECLERAVEELNHHSPSTLSTDSLDFSLRLVTDHIGEELARDWDWCDVLCLPTLSENFGLVVAEALARGKRVITTDGAPAWDPSVTGTDYGGRLIYLRGYRDGTDAARIDALKRALSGLIMV